MTMAGAIYVLAIGLDPERIEAMRAALAAAGVAIVVGPVLWPAACDDSVNSAVRPSPREPDAPS
jgi:hypothetical protein